MTLLTFGGCGAPGSSRATWTCHWCHTLTCSLTRETAGLFTKSIGLGLVVEVRGLHYVTFFCCSRFFVKAQGPCPDVDTVHGYLSRANITIYSHKEISSLVLESLAPHQCQPRHRPTWGTSELALRNFSRFLSTQTLTHYDESL